MCTFIKPNVMTKSRAWETKQLIEIRKAIHDRYGVAISVDDIAAFLEFTIGDVESRVALCDRIASDGAFDFLRGVSFAELCAGIGTSIKLLAAEFRNSPTGMFDDETPDFGAGVKCYVKKCRG